MAALSSRASRIIERLFPPDVRDEVRARLEEDCGANLTFAQTLGDAGIDRVRLAVLKLSAGEVAKLKTMVGHAKVDWRDVLVWAGFGNSLAAHGQWASEILETRPH